MIRISYPIFDTSIEFEENKVNILVIESVKYYREFIENMRNLENKMESEIFFTQNYEEIDITKISEIIYYYEYVNFDTRKIINNIYSDLEKVAVDNLYLETNTIISEIEKYLMELVEKIDLEISFEELDIIKLFKSVNLKATQNYSSLVEKIVDYINLISKLFNKRLFIFFNLKTVLEEKELIQIYNHCNYQKIHLLLCENTMREKLKYEKIKLIDKDLCEII